MDGALVGVVVRGAVPYESCRTGRAVVRACTPKRRIGRESRGAERRLEHVEHTTVDVRGVHVEHDGPLSDRRPGPVAVGKID